MDILGPIGPIDTKMAMEIQRQGVLARLLSCIHYILPDPPVSAAARLSALPSHDAVDRVSRLPDALLGDIVSRLPVKDAGRTAALSRRWRGVWRSAPLVLVDADLLPVESTAGARADARRVTSAVSRVLAAHPGPFRCVHLTSSYLEEFHGPLTRWFDLLVANGIQELVLVSRRWPLNIVLPATFLDMATLTRLYLGLWKFPDTTGLPRAASFPNLLELGLCGIFMDSKDLDYILDRSPVLETLYVEANLFKLRLRLVSQSLRCILLIGCFFEEIFVVDAPRLERIILSEASTPDDSCTKVKIGHAPNLNLLGCLELDPGTQVLEVGNTVIKVQNDIIYACGALCPLPCPIVPHPIPRSSPPRPAPPRARLDAMSTPPRPRHHVGAAPVSYASSTTPCPCRRPVLDAAPSSTPPCHGMTGSTARSRCGAATGDGRRAGGRAAARMRATRAATGGVVDGALVGGLCLLVRRRLQRCELEGGDGEGAGQAAGLALRDAAEARGRGEGGGELAAVAARTARPRRRTRRAVPKHAHGGGQRRCRASVGARAHLEAADTNAAVHPRVSMDKRILVRATFGRGGGSGAQSDIWARWRQRSSGRGVAAAAELGTGRGELS